MSIVIAKLNDFSPVTAWLASYAFCIALVGLVLFAVRRRYPDRTARASTAERWLLFGPWLVWLTLNNLLDVVPSKTPLNALVESALLALIVTSAYLAKKLHPASSTWVLYLISYLAPFVVWFAIHPGLGSTQPYD